ncbi:hypothetical protein [Flavobacterium muglaense]|uniref:LysE type translocator n=1 Tax=Flavobacterium muglaense TaxID=2764716 RepID=A0A923SHU9_9FLAO|nr:hypothetical protein [Flavobacterium muglaense]MBC5839534.1 hypothetical protein [Flavobacterium muglaense]MBC5846059.1 hypothetical protein [Flavobacterium muglaense]
MKALKNSLMGFVVSFLGSIPLGYLNFIGFEMYTQFGVYNLIWYLLGVIAVEGLVVYFTLIFANSLVNNKKLMKIIDVFGFFFLLLLAYSFYSQSNQTVGDQHYLDPYIKYSPFVIGVLLSSVNFLQLPFWTGWNLYLINGKYIDIQGTRKYYYVAGTLAGTFGGMAVLVYVLYTLALNASGFSSYLLPVVIPILFLGLALFQAFKVYKKYVQKSKT